MTDGSGLFKIGESENPKKRLKQLRTGNTTIELVAYGDKVSEKYLHQLLFNSRVELEWFKLSDEKLEQAVRLINVGELQGESKPDGELKATPNKNGKFIKDGVVVKREGRWYSLSDAEIKRNADGRKKSESLSKKYVISFGKYKDTKIKDMVSPDQYDYCVWLYNEMKNKLSKNEKKKSRKYKAFSWAVKNNNLVNLEN